MVRAEFRRVAAGEQLGNLEYLIDDSVVLQYRNLAGKCSGYPNLMADDCGSMAMARFRDVPLQVVWRRFDFLRPPISGRRIQVGGWLKDVTEVGGSPWLRVSAFAVDEIGTEILRSEAAFVAVHLGEQDNRAETDLGVQRPACAQSDFSERVGDSTQLGTWIVPSRGCLGIFPHLQDRSAGREAQIESNGSGQLLAGWLEGQIGRIFGDDFRWGGRLTLAYRAPIVPGDAVTADAVVVERDEDHAGTSSVGLVLAARNQRNERAVVGAASLKIPSPRLL